jgi:hypothetical protein
MEYLVFSIFFPRIIDLSRLVVDPDTILILMRYQAGPLFKTPHIIEYPPIAPVYSNIHL